MSSTVDRAIDILEFCSEGQRSVQDIADHMGTHRTTALRLVQTFANRSLLVKGLDGRYSVGVRTAGLAQHAIEQSDLRSVAHQYVVRLAQELGYSVHLAAVRPHILSIDIVEPPYSIHMPLRVGGTVLLHTAGVAKAMLAYIPPEEAEHHLRAATWERYTDQTITSSEEMWSVLRDVRKRGWGYDNCEFEEISNSIAAPIRNYASQVAGAVSITAFKAQADLGQLQTHVERLLETTAAISHGLGWTGRYS